MQNCVGFEEFVNGFSKITLVGKYLLKVWKIAFGRSEKFVKDFVKLHSFENFVKIAFILKNLLTHLEILIWFKKDGLKYLKVF